MQLTSLLRTAATVAALSVVLLIALPEAHAQEGILYNFCSGNCYDGASPTGSLVADRYGNFYGTTQSGGTGGCDFFCMGGTAFQLSAEPATGCPSGFKTGHGWCETVLYNFCSANSSWPYCPDGALPYANLTIQNTGTPYNPSMNLYGTTYNGGTGSNCQDPNGYGCGIVFELSPRPLGGICPSGTNVGNGWCETVLYNFCSQSNCADGSYPVSGLVRDSSGNLYGVNSAGVFKLYQVNGVWQEQIIYSVFRGNGGLAIDAGGNLYGVDGNENVFKLSYTCGRFCLWHFRNIHTFGAVKDGALPVGTPALDSAGNVYGMTAEGGSLNYGTVWKLTLLTKGTLAGTYQERILHNFTSVKTGYYPEAGVTLDSAGNIYGTTTVGGSYNTLTACQYPGLGSGCGTVFKLTVNGDLYTYKLLWSFNGTNGAFPWDSPILDSSGNLYGTTYEGGGPGNGGAVFEVTPSSTATTTTLTSSANPSTFGEAVMFTATASSSAGAPPDGETINFVDSSTVLGSGTLSGGVASYTTSSLPVGASVINAVYGGDLKLGPSTSKIVRQLVER